MYYILKSKSPQHDRDRNCQKYGIVAVEPATSLISASLVRGGASSRGAGYSVSYNLPLPWMFFCYDLSLSSFGGKITTCSLAFARDFTPGDEVLNLEQPYVPNVLGFPGSYACERFGTPEGFSATCNLDITTRETWSPEVTEDYFSSLEQEQVRSLLQNFYERPFIFWSDLFFYTHQLTKELSDQLPPNNAEITHNWWGKEDIKFAQAYYSLLESMTQEEINKYSWGPVEKVRLDEIC